MGFAAYSLVAPNQGTVTADLKLVYLRPGFAGELTARGYVIKAGKMLYFCEADIFCTYNGNTELIARGYSTMAAVEVPEYNKNFKKPIK
jgi:acyl-coenzyme A thioesterase PaaI-like protein